MTTYLVQGGAAIHPGAVAAAGPGDRVAVFRSALARHDWAPFVQAIGAAYARGAEVWLSTESNPRDIQAVTAGLPESDNVQVSGGAS